MLLCETPLRPPNVELLDADIQNCGRERLKHRLRGLKDNLGIDLLPKPSLARLTEVLATFDGEQLLEYTILYHATYAALHTGGLTVVLLDKYSVRVEFENVRDMISSIGRREKLMSQGCRQEKRAKHVANSKAMINTNKHASDQQDNL